VRLAAHRGRLADDVVTKHGGTPAVRAQQRGEDPDRDGVVGGTGILTLANLLRRNK
jgi:hypothetical protein